MIIKDDFGGGSISDHDGNPRMFPSGMKYPPVWIDDPWDDYEAEEDEDEETEDCEGE